MVKVPKKSKTLALKVRAGNPWLIGNELADVIEQNWEVFTKVNGQDYANFCHAISQIPDFKRLCSVKYLSCYHVADTIVKLYLR